MTNNWSFSLNLVISPILAILGYFNENGQNSRFPPSEPLISLGNNNKIQPWAEKCTFSPILHFFANFAIFSKFSENSTLLRFWAKMEEMCSFCAQGWKWCSSTRFSPSKMGNVPKSTTTAPLWAIFAFLRKKALFGEISPF